MFRVLFFLVLVSSSTSFASKRPIKIAVFGDSVTAAVFADEKLGNPSHRYYSDTRNVVKKILLSAVFGHKITPDNKATIEEFDRVASRYKRTHYSFALGRADYSLRARVRRKLGIDIDVVDLSILAAGYEVSDIALRRLKNNVRKTGIAPDVIVVNYTAMDFLHAIPTKKFSAYVRAFYTELVVNYPKSHIVMGQLINPIRNIIREDRVAAPIHPILLIPGIPLTCKGAFEMMQFAKGLNMYPGYKGSRIAENEAQFKLFESELEKVATDIENKQGKFANFQGELARAGDPSVAEKLGADIAADCIHPTIKGQKAISEVFWKSSEYLFSEKYLANYDFTELPNKCENSRGYGKIFWCGFGFCAKKSQAQVASDMESSFCRVTAY